MKEVRRNLRKRTASLSAEEWGEGGIAFSNREQKVLLSADWMGRKGSLEKTNGLVFGPLSEAELCEVTGVSIQSLILKTRTYQQC